MVSCMANDKLLVTESKHKSLGLFQMTHLLHLFELAEVLL